MICTASLQNCTDSFTHDGLIDEHAVWKGRVLSSSDMSSLYNSGSGVSYASLATSTTATSSANVQNSSYTYDAVGNILSIADNAIGGTGSAVSYTYDDYHRLVSASTTAASSTPFLRTYSYDSLGNLTYKSDIGSYAYSTTTYANPHAATSVGGVSYSYDSNGNLTSVGTGSTSISYTWDWRDRLTRTASSTATTTYAYDEGNQRVRKTTNLAGVFATTTYPSRYFNYSSSGTTTAHILLPDGSPIATVEANGVATSTYWLHLDHLNSIQVITNASGTPISVSDSYPYGNPRIASSSTSYQEQRGYIGENYDSDSSLSYLNARYLSNTRGQFLSEDPMFWSYPKTQNIANPQSMNCYSYADDNPLTKRDPTGKCPWCLPFLIGGIGGGLSQYSSDVMANRAAGITGSAAFTSNLSSWQEYNAAVATGAIAGAVSTAGLIYGGIATTFGSGVQDWAGGNAINPGKAIINGISMMATGGLFKWGAGLSPASMYTQSTGRAFSSIPSSVFRNEFRYVVSSEMLGSGVNTIIQARYQQAQNYNTSISPGFSAGTSGGSSLAGTHWVTPSGAIVSWEGTSIAEPASKSTPAVVK